MANASELPPEQASPRMLHAVLGFLAATDRLGGGISFEGIEWRGTRLPVLAWPETTGARGQNDWRVSAWIGAGLRLQGHRLDGGAGTGSPARC